MQKKIKQDEKAYQKRFSGYEKNKADPEKISSEFEEIKSKIMKSGK